MKTSFYLLFLTFCLNSIVYGQTPNDICEDSVPDNWEVVNGKLSLSNERFKIGKESIKWEWTDAKDNYIHITDTAFESVASNSRSTFVFWVYNEIPTNDKLEFQFLNQEQVNSSFDFSLNFKGWRTAWVMYNRDMRGQPQLKMNSLKIKAPKSLKQGSLYFDQVLYNVTINPRSPMQDNQVSFVNLEGDKAANAHWNSLYLFSNTPHYLPLPSSLTAQDKKDISVIEARYVDIIFPKAGSPIEDVSIEEIERSFAFWNIKRDGNRITGKPVLSTNDIELISLSPPKAAKLQNEQSGIKLFTTTMFNVAKAHSNSTSELERQRLEEIFMEMLDHLDDQGWSYGSGLGALHHHGYNLGSFYSACLLMKDQIKENNRLDRTIKTMFWLSGLGRTLERPEKMPPSNIDVFNTLLGSMLSTILMMEDSTEKVRYLESFTNWMSKNIQPNFAINGAFKPDGAVFHHGNLYPAYGIGGYNGIAPILYVLSRTQFRIPNSAHKSFRKSMLMMHYYTNPYRWPISISGRHPTGDWRITDKAYAYMALAGIPNGEKDIDNAMASIFLKVRKKNDHLVSQFKNIGIKEATYPDGHWNLNYGLLDIHRRQDWLLSIRGHNRYFVSHESYPGANVFGRYLTYGHLEVLFPQTKINDGSNFKDEGWDWNNIPGTTTLYQPIDELRADIENVDDFSGIEEMLLSDEIFAGGTSFNKQGMFSMKLRGHDKYDMGSFRAIKSYFVFDSLVVSLGSGISNDIKEYPTQTTLFQNYLTSKSDTLWVGENSITSFPYSYNRQDKSKAFSVIDNRKIGYYMPGSNNFVLTKENQVSRDQKDLRVTSGNFSKLVINHGNAPTNDSYEYAMLINTDQEKMGQFIKDMRSAQPVYKVLKQDSLIHSIWYAPQNITALSVFSSKQKLNDSLLIENSRPCLIMYQHSGDKLKMSVTDPDLAFYEGPDDSPVTADGKRKEVSIYSREWFKTSAKPSVIELTIKGLWEPLDTNKSVKGITWSGNTTLISIDCRYGLVSNVELTKKK